MANKYRVVEREINGRPMYAIQERILKSYGVFGFTTDDYKWEDLLQNHYLTGGIVIPIREFKDVYFENPEDAIAEVHKLLTPPKPDKVIYESI